MDHPSSGLTLHSEPPPLREDADGSIRVGNTRITLDLIVEQYEAGMTPDAMVRAYDSLSLPDAFGAVAYFLRHRKEVDAYLTRRRAKSAALQSKVESAAPATSKQELLARRASREADGAAVGR